MTSKSFGVVLIVIGVLAMFSMFVFSDWHVGSDFISNIRYAALFEIEGEKSYLKENITLGQGLILPLIIVAIGALLKFEIIESKVARKIAPFLKE